MPGVGILQQCHGSVRKYKNQSKISGEKSTKQEMQARKWPAREQRQKPKKGKKPAKKQYTKFLDFQAWIGKTRKTKVQIRECKGGHHVWFYKSNVDHQA